MTTIHYVTVIWKCKNCGAQGKYLKWNPDAENGQIHEVIETKVMEECPACTDGVEGTEDEN